MAKTIFKQIYKLALVTLLCLAIMVCIASFLQDDGIGGTSAEYILMIIWELIYVFSYVVVFKKSVTDNFENYSKDIPFDAKGKLKNYFSVIGKLHFIIFLVVAVLSYFGRFIMFGKINYISTLAVMVLPIAGIFGRAGYLTGILGLLSHIILIPPSILLAQWLHRRKMIKRSLK